MKFWYNLLHQNESGIMSGIPEMPGKDSEQVGEESSRMAAEWVPGIMPGEWQVGERRFE